MPDDIRKNNPSPLRALLSLPGLAFIALYLLLQAASIILSVVAGGDYPPLFLIFAAGFIAASSGLLLLFRWAWALALGAVCLLVVYNLWIFTSLRETHALVQGLLNLFFFFYLIRTEVRAKLR
jgi:uncharacterized protein (DUF983 family)